MKNFTNNFKQFTSRLSARWLIMALMMLVGTSSAWAAANTLGTGETIKIKFDRTNAKNEDGWNGKSYLYMVYSDNSNSTVEINGEYIISSEGKIPSKIKFYPQYDWSGNKGQTAEIQDCNSGALKANYEYTVKLTGKYSGSGAQRVFAHTLDCKTINLCETTFVVAGSSGLANGEDWNQNSTKNVMTCNQGIYTITFNNVAAGNYEYKVVKQGDWSVAYPGKNKPISFDSNSNVTITFNSLTKEVSHDVTDACFTINDLDIIASKTSICDAESVTLTLNNKQSGVTYKIGNTTIFNSSDAKPTYNTGAITGVSSKSYTIEATATGQCEAKTKTIAITVNSIPATPTFNAAPSYCAGDNITLPIKDKAGNSVTWYKQDGSAAGTPLNTAGPHTYKAKATNTSGCVSTDFGTYSYTVKPIPVAGDFSLTGVPQGGFTYNRGTQVPVIETSLQGIGTITPIYYLGNNKVNTPTDAGTYTVKITVSAGTTYCAMSETQIGTFTINKANQTTPTITANSTNICGKEATFAVSGGESTGNYSYTLDKNDANATREGTTLKATQSGSVTLKVKKLGDTNYNDSEEAVKEFNFTMPIENVTLSKVEDDKTTYCVGDKVEFKLNYNGPYPANYAWSGSAMGSLEPTGKTAKVLDNGASWYIDFTEAKTYTIALSLTGCNTQSSNELSFTVNALPGKPIFDAIPDQCSSYTLPKEDKYQVSVNWYNAATGGEKITSVNTTGTYYAEAVNANNCTSTQRTAVEIIIDKTPTISGATIAQPGKQNKIELTVPTGITAEWSVSPEADLSVSKGNSTMFSAETNGTYTITATNGTCSDTHVVTVADAFYIWVRNAKESDYAYGQFYYPNENSEAVRGGEMFYAECDALPTSSNYSTYNRGGREADLVQNDCDGYTWYGFKASEEVISGTKYFYVRATNDISDGGYYTHSKPLKGALTGDVYYTLGTTGDSYRGWNLATASAPYAGPKVHASGSTTLGTNKFAALYVTDCSGKEITDYQWEYCSTQNGKYNPYSASVSNNGTLYSGDAGTTNNIRPSEEGWYRCKVTYDSSNATSEPVQVTGTYTYTSSSLPVFVVNTNGEGFPVNDCSGTPSKNADDMKAKVSVDVKIYQDGTMVYDRKARMNYRGSSSLNFLKKSYAFCPGKDNCVEDKGRQDYVKTEKMNMLKVGSAEDKDWVLYAAAPDPSLMRNRLVFDTYKEMTGKWGVSSRFVKLYVDGTYKGIYVLMDKITKNKKRVDITDENGFIVKFDKTDKVDRVGGYQGVLGDEKTFKTTRTGADDLDSYDTSIDQRFEIEYPEKDDYPTGWSAKVNSIKAMFEGFENALAAKDFATVQKYIDYDSWADWFIISEYAKNVDAYRASCIFVYNGDKIEATPLWDQELSFNNQTMLNHGNNDATGLLVTESSIYGDSEKFKAPFWFTNKGTDINNITGGLLSDPCFVQVVKEKWNQYSTGTGALTQNALNEKIKAYTDELDGATDVSFNRGTMDCGNCQDGACKSWGTGYSDISKPNSITNLTTWITNRGNGLTTALNNLTGASFSIQIIPSQAYTTPWEPVEIAVSVTPAGYDYKLEYTDNNLGGVANTIIKKEGDKITYRIPRPDAWGTGDAEEGARDDIEYGIKATLSVQDGTTVCGSQAAPSSTGKIILQDEDNEKCQQPEP